MAFKFILREGEKKGEENDGERFTIYIYIKYSDMRYKQNVLGKIEQLDNVINRLETQVNRNFSQNQILETIILLKSQVEDLRSIISVQQDEFEKQF